MSQLCLLLLSLLSCSQAQLDPTSLLLIGLAEFEPVDLPDTEDDIMAECQPTGQVPEYPLAAGNLFAPSSIFIKDMVLVCGGFDGLAIYGDCYSIAKGEDEWVEQEPMLNSVFRAGFTKFGEGGKEFIWVAG